MADPKYNFQYCQKIVLFSEDWQKVLLAQRRGEQDYDEIYSLIGGKMDANDKTIIASIRREKDEEIGTAARIALYPDNSYNLLFRKKDGSRMILPHYVAQYIGGEIVLNHDEYTKYQWVSVDQIHEFEPKIDTIPEVVRWALGVKDLSSQRVVEV